ncbi:MAG: MBL fold metallo-hydrolase [Dehalococcoidia bacterium]
MKISESVRAAMVPDENPMHPDFTSIYLVGPQGGQSLAIDSGEAMERYQWFLRGYLAAVEQAEIGIAAITHHHQDHSGNLKWVHEELRAEVSIPENGRQFLKGRIPAEVNALTDGDVIDLGRGVRVQVLATPGHSVDSLCYYIEEEGVLFTGDTLLGSSTTTVWDLGHYRRSLQRLLELPNLQVICPGHGKIVEDPRERLQMYVDHRNQRERQILEVLQAGKPMSSWDIMLEVYPTLSPGLRRGADGNVRSHLKQLEEEGRIRSEPGTPRRPESKAKVERQREHARAEDRIIRQARKIEDARRRASLRQQENPAATQWQQPPLYGLA